MPRYRAADTLIVCRTAQWAEAATVLSCFPAGVLPPLFVLETEPCSEVEYAALYESYREMRDRRDRDAGTWAAHRDAQARGTANDWSEQEIDRRIEALTPFRRMVKRRDLLARVFRALPLRRALFLFDATSDDMSVIEALPKERLDLKRREPLLAEGLEWTFLSGPHDKPLWQRAWEAVRPGEPRPNEALEVAREAGTALAGLYRARTLDRPLHLVDTAEAATIRVCEPADGKPAECVLVETLDRADDLVAVHYALQQGARLCVRPRPETGPIEAARQAIQAWQEARHPIGQAAPLAALQAEVANAVPTAVVDAVGALPLTAFTEALPYSLLRSERADWSDKPIGLMTGDALLIASVEMFGRGETVRPDARFDLLFDPGYFRTGETDTVLAVIDDAAAVPVLLRQRAASTTALIAARGLPVDLVYFDTHGSEEAIQLQDMPLPDYKLMQRVSLRSRPIVFNNSCLSWNGVGREFIAAGARGYVGTLWSVVAGEAARFAATVAQRITTGGMPIAASLRRTGVDPLTEQAYVFAGTVAARLRLADASGDADERKRIAGAATLLFQAIRFLLAQGPGARSPQIGPALHALFHRAEELAACLDERWPGADARTLPLLTERLDVASRLPSDPRLVAHCDALRERGKQLASTESPTATDAKPAAWPSLEDRTGFWRICGRVLGQQGRAAAGIEMLRRATRALRTACLPHGLCSIELSDLLAASGKIDMALAAALEARAEFAAATGPEVRRHAMLASGRLAQLQRKAGHLEAALLAAQDGWKAALELEDLAEQATFRLDQARIHQLRGDLPAAIAAAEDALATTRRNHDEDGEVKAFGGLTLALIADRQWPRARVIALDGLEAARRRGLLDQVVDFLVDLSDIESAGGDLALALARLQEAGPALARLGSAAMGRRVLGKAGALATRLGDWDTERRLLALVATTLTVLEGADRIEVCSGTVRSLLGRIARSGWPASREWLWLIRSDFDRAIAAQAPPPGPVQLGFLHDVVAACHERSKGPDEATVAHAAALDAISENGFGLAAFMAPDENPEHPAWRAARAAATGD